MQGVQNNMVLMVVLCMSFVMQASVQQASLEDLMRYEQAMKLYRERKDEIRSQHNMSSSTFNGVKSALQGVMTSDDHIEKIVSAYRRALSVDIDLDARNSWKENGGFLLGSGFFDNFFKDLLFVIRESHVQFKHAPGIENGLQIMYVHKFLDNKMYRLPENFGDYIRQMGHREVRSVHDTLQKICKQQRLLLRDIKHASETRDLNSLKSCVQDSLSVLEDMRDFVA